MNCKECHYFKQSPFGNTGTCNMNYGIVANGSIFRCDEFKKIITYGDVERKFHEKNPNLKNKVNDYRPHGNNSIIIWFTNGTEIIVEYNPETDDFEILEINKIEVTYENR